MTGATDDASRRSDPPLVRMQGITKRFGPVTVLDDVRLDLQPGEVHILAGENGAGKSTLIKILGGVHLDFAGTIEIQGRVVRPRNPLDANDLGVAVIHQELSLIGPMSVADNIFLGRMPARAGFVRDGEQRERAHHWLAQLGLELDVSRTVESFPLATRQLIEIAKALSRNARVIVMDEPTSALNAPEVEHLFTLIQRLKAQGCAVVYISHKMEEIERVADRITVLRDGRYIGTDRAANLPPAKLIEWMVGRKMGEQFPRHAARLGESRLRIERFSVYPRGWSSPPAAREVSLAARAGEIVGIAGLQGSGASELLLGLFGAYGPQTRGQVFVDGHPLRFRSPRQAIAAGLGLLTNDRKHTGLVLGSSIVFNTTLPGLRALSPGGWRRPGREREAARRATEPLHLRAASLDMNVNELSGGNQQKVVLAKWRQIQPRILLLDEPTRGIDVGSKREIYELMNQSTAQGVAILLITSEMPELLALADRVVVLHRGRITAEFSRQQATPQRILEAAMGQRGEREEESTHG